MEKSPDAFRTISEVAEALDTPAHVLRFWESRFTQIKPVKRAGGRRYYRPADMALLGGIKHLLHDEGMTIRGVQKILREQGIRHVAAIGGGAPWQEAPEDTIEAAAVTPPPPPPDNVVAMRPARPDPEPDPAPAPDLAAEAAAPASSEPDSTVPDPAVPEPAVPEQAPPLAQQAEAAEPDIEPQPEPRVQDSAPSGVAPVPPSPPGPSFAPPAGPDSPAPDSHAPAASEDEDPPSEDQRPTLAARLRRLSPEAVGPDLDALATFADRLKALRHKMAGHARRGQN